MNAAYQQLDLSGWIVLQNLLAPGDDIMIKGGDDSMSRLFDRDVHAIVKKVSSNNLIAIDILTEDVRDMDGNPWGAHPYGFMDIMWDVSVLLQPLTPTHINLKRIDGKTWMLQGPFPIQLEKETDDYYFGWPTNDEAPRKRVWPKSEFGI